MAYTKYSLTPANNTATPPDGAPEGMLPSAVNDTMRDMMAQIRDCGDGIRDGTYTMTAPKITGGTITGSTINNSAIGGTTAAAGKFTTLEATGVTTVQAGTVSAPAITTTGDTNTGIFFPAADTIAFTEGGVESMRIDSSGNVGIGVAPSAWSTVVPALQIGGGGAFLAALGSSPYVALGTNAHYNGTNFVYRTTNTASYYDQSSGLHRWYTAPSGTAGTNVTFTQAMTLDASGNVGIGTSSPAFPLDVRAATSVISAVSTTGTNSAYMYVSNTGGDFYLGRDNSAGTTFGTGTGYSAVLYSAGAYPMVFFTNAAERMRITSGGEVYIAGTTDQGAYNLQVNGTGIWGAGAYVNGSDERIKDNIAPLDSGLDVVSKLNPVTYKYKEDWSKDQSTQTGFIAQELLTALEGKNYVDGVVQQGGEYMSVAYQNIIPILTKAIQEQQAMIEELKAKVTALENK